MVYYYHQICSFILKNWEVTPIEIKKKLSLPIVFSLYYFWTEEFVGVKLNKVTGTEKQEID